MNLMDYIFFKFYLEKLIRWEENKFTNLRIEPTSKVKVEYDRSKLLDVVEVDDYDDLHPHPFSLLYFDLHTYSGILASDDAIRVIKVRYEQNYVVFDNSEEKVILQQFRGVLLFLPGLGIREV